MGIHLTERGSTLKCAQVIHLRLVTRKGGKYESGEKLRAGIQAGFPLCAAAWASVDFRFLHTGIFPGLQIILVQKVVDSGILYTSTGQGLTP